MTKKKRKQRPAHLDVPSAAASQPPRPDRTIDDASSCGANRLERTPEYDTTHFGEYLLDTTNPYLREVGDPTHRNLRIYTLDPAVSRLDGAITTARVPYESLTPGPAGHLFTVELFDEVQRIHYAPADLDSRFVLGQSGHEPSPSDPRFHAQMVYAVASMTYECFREALGRHLNWGSPRAAKRGGRIILRPFGSGDRNAYYDKKSGEIRFGYFCADDKVDGRNLPRGYVFTSLSHDVIVHETTHAIIDGLRPRFMVPTNPDVYAFHEGFADVVALLQHFSFPDVVAAAIRQSSAAIESAELLTDIARQFGHTTGSKGPLRSVRQTSDVGTTALYDETAESHALGSVFASAVFEAFITVYRRRAARTLRVARVSANPRAEELTIEVQQELARQASNVARQLLSIAIRAVDLCPPVDIELGEFLRAAITADGELFPDDAWCYREAWIDAFRKREIYPSNVSSLSEDALVWRPPAEGMSIKGLRFGELRFQGTPGEPDADRELHRRAIALWDYIRDGRMADFGLCEPDAAKGIGIPKIVSIRSSRRIGQNEEVAFDLIAQVLQKRMVRIDGSELPYYGGSTIVIGPAGDVRYVIAKNIDSQRRLERMHRFATSASGRELWQAYLSNDAAPPFRLVHNRRQPGDSLDGDATAKSIGMHL